MDRWTDVSLEGALISLMLMSSCPSVFRDGEESNWLLLEAAVRLRAEPRRSPGDWCWVSPGWTPFCNFTPLVTELSWRAQEWQNSQMKLTCNILFFSHQFTRKGAEQSDTHPACLRQSGWPLLFYQLLITPPYTHTQYLNLDDQTMATVNRAKPVSKGESGRLVLVHKQS